MVDWSGFQIARDRIQPESSWSCYRCTLNSSKRAVPKTAEATGDLIGNKVADKITSVSKSAKELNNNDQTKEEDVEITTHKKRYISPEERQQIIEELRLVPKKVWMN